MMPYVHHPAGHKLFYQKTGDGKRVILFFHGFGQDHKAFNKISEAALPDHTCYSFDLFFHGNSQWVSDKPITKKDWAEFIRIFLEENQIHEFNLIGFSIGCRFALTTAELFPTQTRNLVLLAADGLQFRFWFWLATSPAICRQLFKSLISKPSRWNKLLSFIEFTHLVDRKLLRFAQRQMDSVEKRERVYNSWVTFRHLKSNATELNRLIFNHKVTVSLIAGTRDKVVSASLIRKLVSKVKAAQFHAIAAGHHDLISLSQAIVLSILRYR